MKELSKENSWEGILAAQVREGHGLERAGSSGGEGGMDSRCILTLELTRHVNTDAMKEGGHTGKERGVGEILRRCPCLRAWRRYVIVLNLGKFIELYMLLCTFWTVY